MRPWLLLAVLSGCAPPPEVVYGEVHLHQFTGGSHPGAFFIARPTPRSLVQGDSVLPPDPPVAVGGECALTTTTCTRCVPPVPVDAGTIHIRGGTQAPVIDLSFSADQHGYLAGDNGTIFRGGDHLTIRGDGAVAPAFVGELDAPGPLILTQPTAPALGTGDFVVAWVPDRATRVAVDLVVSTPDGRWALVSCTAPDADGRLVLPAALLAGVPAAPRDLQLVASRDQLVLAPGQAPSSLVILHAGQETRVDWSE